MHSSTIESILVYSSGAKPVSIASCALSLRVQWVFQLDLILMYAPKNAPKIITSDIRKIHIPAFLTFMPPNGVPADFNSPIFSEPSNGKSSFHHTNNPQTKTASPRAMRPIFFSANPYRNNIVPIDAIIGDQEPWCP